MRDVSDAEAHFDCAEGSKQHRFIEVAQMADAKYLAFDLAEAVAERNIEPFQDRRPERVGVMAFGQTHASQDIGALCGVLTLDVEAPGLNRAAGGLATLAVRESVVAGPGR